MSRTRNLLITSRTRIQLSHQGRLQRVVKMDFSQCWDKRVKKLMLSTLGKIFSRWLFEIFSYFSQNIGLDISYKLCLNVKKKKKKKLEKYQIVS